jgi:hypothetical protein
MHQEKETSDEHASWVLVEKEREGTCLDYWLVGRHGCALAAVLRSFDATRCGTDGMEVEEGTRTAVLVYKWNGTGSDRSVIDDMDGILLALPI